WVVTRDGVRLATDVYLPAGGRQDSRFPAIVVRTCYGKTRDTHRLTHWVYRGYALVIQDVRGRSDSDGELVPFYYERDDAYDLFDWIIEQPWSDGNIGMWGASYLGYTTTAAATSGHPNLKTAISEVNVGSPFFMDTVRRGGAVCSWPLLSWTLAQSVSNRVDHKVFRGVTVDPDKVVKTRPITEIPSKIIGKRSGPWDIWARHYQYDEFWEHCDNTSRGKNVRIPMLILSGWHDGDALGVQETWRFLTANDTPGRRIIIGPWPHDLNSFRDCGDFEYGDNAVDYDFDTRTIRWFDHYLKGAENGEDQKPRASFYLGGKGENKWYDADDWSPPEAKLTRLYFHSSGKANSMHGDGCLLTSPVDGHRFDSYVYDPQNAGRGEGKFEPSVLNEQHCRQDCLVYETAVLTEPVAVAGNLSTEFYAASSAVDTDFFVRVSDVDEHGIARQIAQNGIRAEFRNWPETPSAPLVPGKVEKYYICLHFAGHVFQPGHRIRVDVCSADYITFFPNTNTGVDPYTDPEPIVATQQIYHGKDYLSCVRIPILYGKV
ncbi:MAG: CocE/NonD family hydrolase, partial [Kiritimatiellae bacterium]|nr:CocE/NonD family hydrolase [Kiritimatiellia bacterium]